MRIVNKNDNKKIKNTIVMIKIKINNLIAKIKSNNYLMYETKNDINISSKFLITIKEKEYERLQ